MTIQVFEHQVLKIGEQTGFDEAVWEALIRFNDRHGQRYFTVIHKGVRFGHYVGVIQIGRLTIEVLPKADAAASGDKNHWQSVLIAMLKSCRLLKIETLSNARLRLQQHFILDLYFELFIEAVEKLIHEGLIKKYKNSVDNQNFMRGKLNFQKQIQHNLIHKNRFFTEHTTYDFDHLLNQILSATISVLVRTVTNSFLLDKLLRLQLHFPKVKVKIVTATDFDRLTFDRKSQRYQTALEIARLILLNYSPDIRGGQHHVLAILFDMNVLFETFIFKQLKQLEMRENIHVIGQPSRKFWNNRHLRPDILIQKETKKIIIDTKWKILQRLSPTDEDLRQMYAYAHIFKAQKTLLIYPKVFDFQLYTKGTFNQSNHLQCDLFFTEIIQITGQLNPQIGEAIIEVL